MLYLVGHLYLHHTRHDIDLMEPRLTARTAGRATNSDSLKRTDRDRDEVPQGNGVARQVVATSARYLSPIVRWRPVGSPDRTNVRLFVVIAHVACPPHEVSPRYLMSSFMSTLWNVADRQTAQCANHRSGGASDIGHQLDTVRSTFHDIWSLIELEP